MPPRPDLAPTKMLRDLRQATLHLLAEVAQG
jgi:hypothetical protein